MSLITIAVFTVAGVAINRIRGGGLVLGKALGAYADEFNAVVFGTLLWLMFGLSPSIALLSAMAMWVGENIGWGRYISAIMSEKIPSGEEVSQIDKFIERLETSPVKWGAAGLTLRGMIWAFPLCLVLQSFIPFVAGALMGASYLAAKEIQRRLDTDVHAWAIGEHIFGGLLWLSCALTFI